jgi:hypothetical protein
MSSRLRLVPASCTPQHHVRQATQHSTTKRRVTFLAGVPEAGSSLTVGVAAVFSFESEERQRQSMKQAEGKEKACAKQYQV